LQAKSSIVTINESAINAEVDAVNTLTQEHNKENQTYITLNVDNSGEIPKAEVTAIRGQEGDNNQATIQATESPDDPSRKGGLYIGSPKNNVILIGQVHGHPTTEDPGKVNGPGTSPLDAQTSKEYGIPIYSIDSYTQSDNPNINRVLPNGTTSNGIGRVGDKKIGLGKDALLRSSGIIMR
jgi:hypothetical protein